MSGDRSSLAGRGAVVTGGSGFLGSVWVDALRSAGADVVSLDLHPPTGAVADGVRHEAVDITEPAALAELAARLAADGLVIDVLVNNAAVDAPVGASGLARSPRLETFPVERWDQEVAVGLTGAFLCCQAFGPGMAERGRGSIINIGSDLGLIGPDQRLYRVEGVAEAEQPVKPVTYSVIKAGLIGLTRYLATYWADAGVRANTLCLGGVAREQDAAFVAELSSRIPLGRMAQAEEYREALVFLASDASSYMTGSTMVLDGGRTTW